MLDKVIGVLDRRLVLTSLLPSAAFWAAVVALVAGQAGWPRARSWWTHLDTQVHLALILAVAALLVLFASLLSAQEGALLGLYEGYWGRRGPGRWFSGLAARWHRRQIGRLNLDDDAQFEHRYRNYPRRAEDAMPTRLGNILKAAEQYPADPCRYAMDAVFFWPRLIAVVPQRVRADLADARTSLALLLNVSALAIILSAGTVAALSAITIRPAAGFWAAAGASVLLAALSYRSALAPARVYAELVRATFDLYKGDLLRQLGYAMPDSLAEERKLWQNLGQQLYRRAASEAEVLEAARKRAANTPAVAPGTSAPPS